MRNIQQEIEAGLSDVRRRLDAGLPTTERDAALILAVLNLLAATGGRDVCGSDDARAVDDVPCIINFERAKAEILTRRARENAPERPRLRVFRGD